MKTMTQRAKKYSAKIDLPFELDLAVAVRNEVLTSPSFMAHTDSHYWINIGTLGHALPQWLQTKGLQITHAEVFHNRPRSSIPPHMDISPRGPELLKMIWELGDSSSRMFWFERKPSCPFGSKHTLREGSPYVVLPRHHLNMVESAKLDRTPIVTTANVPHMVLNSSETESFVFAIALNNSDMSLRWPELYEIFRSESS